VLAISGAITTIHKGATNHFGESGIPVYQLALFASAALCTSCHALIRRGRCTLVEAVFGLAIGTSNGLALVFQLASLVALPAVVFFPTSGALLIALNLAVSWAVWREHLRPRQFAGVALAAAVVVLTNIQ
jgi:drug/metabolite transporter (DMT)-like permease